MVFFTYRYINVETKHLKIISTSGTNIRKHLNFKLELFLTEYGELLILL